MGPGAPNEPLAGHGASGINFFDCKGLRASLTKTLKNEEHSRAPPKTRERFTNSLFFLSQVLLAPIIICFISILICFSDSFSIL